MKPTLVSALACFFLVAACGPHTLVEAPTGDGYGPAGGVSGGTGSSSGSSGSSSGAPSVPTGSPSQPPPVDDDAGTGSGGGAPSPGVDAGGGGGGHAEAGAPDAGHGGEGGGASDAGSTTALLALCVSQVNEVRNQNGVQPLDESTQLEAYAAKASASDANNGQKHSYFYATGGGGVAATEDELDGDQVDPGGDAQATFEQGLQQDVTANGQALANLVSQQFSSVGCGFAQDPAGNWWIDVAFQ